MMFFRNTIVAAAVMMCAAAVAPRASWAQANLPSVDAAGGCPSDDLLRQFNPEIDGSVRSLINRTGSPVRSDVPLYRAPSLTDPVQKRPSSYDDDIVVNVGAKLGETGPALVRRITDGVCGWMDVSALERSPPQMKLIELPGFQEERARQGLPSRLDAHVVVKNRVDQQSGASQRAPIFHRPFDGPEPPDTERRGNVGYFEVLSVYDVRRPNGEKCQRLAEDHCFLRVGTTTITSERRGSPANQNVTHIRGWMLGKDLEVWPSALATYYKPGKQGLKIYKNETSALSGTRFLEQGVRIDPPLAMQPEGRYDEPRDSNIMRFPVIRGTINPDQSYVYEVVFSGQACINGQGGCIPEPQIKDELVRLGKAVKEIGNIDVLIVLDTTESMEPYLRSVTAAIKKHVGDLATNGDVSLRHSVVLYGDYNETTAGGLDYFALPFSPVNDPANIDRLQTVRSYTDIHKDLPEAPFAALERAVSTANWNPEAAQRLVIWIADHGNRQPGTYHTNGGYNLVEDKTAENVIAAIKAVDQKMKAASPTGKATSTHFVALQVKGGSRSSSQEIFLKFHKDADAISRGIGERNDVFQTIDAANIATDAEVAQLRDKIAAQISRQVSAASEARNLVIGGLGGTTTGQQSKLPESLLAREYLTQLGFPPEKLAEMGRRIQVVRNGFIFQGNGDGADYRYWLGLRRPEFERVRNAVKELCENVQYSDNMQFIEDTILKLVEAVTAGQPKQGETVRDYFSRVFSVPVTHLSTILEGTPDQFMQKVLQQSHQGQGQQNQQIVEKICRSAWLLNAAGEGQTVDNPQDVRVSAAGHASLRLGVTPRQFDWRWTSPDARSEWYFVPLDYLP